MLTGQAAAPPVGNGFDGCPTEFLALKMRLLSRCGLAENHEIEDAWPHRRGHLCLLARQGTCIEPAPRWPDAEGAFLYDY